MEDTPIQLYQQHLRFGVRNVKHIVGEHKGKKICKENAAIVLINTINKREIVHPFTSIIYN